MFIKIRFKWQIFNRENAPIYDLGGDEKKKISVTHTREHKNNACSWVVFLRSGRPVTEENELGKLGVSENYVKVHLAKDYLHKCYYLCARIIG
jgi:hypothetical protein